MSRTARAVRWHGAGDVRLEAVPVRRPGADEVLIRPAYCGICGSDIHEVVDGPHAIPVVQPHGLSRQRAPLVLGHEFSGTVEAVGSGVRDLAPGDAVAIEPNYRCGSCPSCREGRYHTCRHFGFAGLMGDGGMAEVVTVPAVMVHRLPPDFDLAQAAVLEPAAVALHAVRRSGVQTGERAVVVGLGPVGLLVCALLLSRGVSEVVGVEPAASRRALAADLGVPRLIDPSASDGPGQAVRAAVGADGAHVAFEVVGKQSTFDVASHSLRSGGTVILVGLASRLEIDAIAFVNDELTVRASVGYRDCHGELISMVARGELDLSPFTTDVVDLADGPDVLSRMAAGEARGLKTLVRCQPSSVSFLNHASMATAVLQA